MPGGFSDPKRTYRVNSENLERRIYVDAYTKEEAVSVLKREGVYEKLPDIEKIQVVEILVEVHGKDIPAVFDDLPFSGTGSKKPFLVKVTPKTVEQRQVYVNASTEKEAMDALEMLGPHAALFIIEDIRMEKVDEKDTPVILEDPYSAIDPTRK